MYARIDLQILLKETQPNTGLGLFTWNESLIIRILQLHAQLGKKRIEGMINVKFITTDDAIGILKKIPYDELAAGGEPIVFYTDGALETIHERLAVTMKNDSAGMGAEYSFIVCCNDKEEHVNGIYHRERISSSSAAGKEADTAGLAKELVRVWNNLLWNELSRQVMLGIEEEESAGGAAIQAKSEEDVYIDDFKEDRYINFHLVPPTEEWLAKRFIWAPSISGPTEAWSRWLARYLLQSDPVMLMCLNRILITTNEEEDIEAVCDLLDKETANESDGDSVCIFPEMDGFIGMFWVYKSSVIINLTALRDCAKELAEENEDIGWNYGSELQCGFLMTLLHELRHLGLDSNIFLPESLYPLELSVEDAVEEWCRNEYERLPIPDPILGLHSTH